MKLPLVPTRWFFNLCCLLVVTNSFSGCQTPHRSYEADRAKLPEFSQAKNLAVIEFDERGDFWNPEQYREAEKMLKSQRAPILITYVHGWLHDARPADSNLRDFMKFLKNVDPGLKGSVCGVYIGWRGAEYEDRGLAGFVSKTPAFLSFWKRKNITDRMAGVPFSSTLWRLAAQADKQGGHSILIGHSFGARIVERTLGPAAIAQMNNRKPMPYNLTFLINPATESLYARQLKLALRNWDSNQPAVVALAAKDDRATGIAWPLAMLVDNNERDRNYHLKNVNPPEETQRSYITTTVGNDPRQFTHKIVKLGEAVTASTQNYAVQNLLGSPEEFSLRLRGPSAGKVIRARIDPLLRTEAPHQLKSNAYWVIALNKDVLSGHSGERAENGIFCPSMSDLMAGIINQVRVLKGDAPVVPLTSPAEASASIVPLTPSP